MCRNLVGDASLLDVVLLGEPEMLFGRHITQHARAMITGRCCTNRAGDVIITGENICHQGPQNIEGGPMTKAPLQLHIVFDLVEGNVPWSLDHHLATISPSS